MAKKRRDIIEIFGYAPTDLTEEVRTLWRLGACPFIGKSCIKFNHDQTIIYGTCSVTSPYGNVIICPNRLYDDNYAAIRRVAEDSFGTDPEFLFFDQYLERKGEVSDCAASCYKHAKHRDNCQLYLGFVPRFQHTRATSRH